MNNFTPLQAARIAAMWQLYRVSAANAEAPAAKGPTPASPLEGGQGGQGQDQSAPPLKSPAPRPGPKPVPKPHPKPTRAPVKKPTGAATPCPVKGRPTLYDVSVQAMV